MDTSIPKVRLFQMLRERNQRIEALESQIKEYERWVTELRGELETARRVCDGLDSICKS